MCDPINSVIFSLFFFFFFAFFQQFFFLLLQLFLSDNTHTRSSFKKHSCRSCLFLVDCSFFSLLFVSQSFIHKGSHSLICTSILLFACRMFPCSPKYLLIFLIAVSSSSWVWCFGPPRGMIFVRFFQGFGFSWVFGPSVATLFGPFSVDLLFLLSFFLFLFCSLHCRFFFFVVCLSKLHSQGDSQSDLHFYLVVRLPDVSL